MKDSSCLDLLKNAKNILNENLLLLDAAQVVTKQAAETVKSLNDIFIIKEDGLYLRKRD
jgi:hypothetical protein